MPTKPDVQVISSRAEARRAQILDAAADCFRKHGFHGASIARISKMSGMSPGHMYHYFDNKEAIIASIVAADVDHVMTLAAELRAACDVREAMTVRAVEGMKQQLDPATAGLAVEIVAEAARNVRIAEIVRAADEVTRACLVDIVRQVRRQDGRPDDDASVTAIAEMIAVMFDGLLVRAIRHPELDHTRFIEVFRRTLLSLLDQDAC